MAIARDRKGEDHHVVALIGDASLAGGMAMEAINQAGHLKSRLIVVLNDNDVDCSGSGCSDRLPEPNSWCAWIPSLQDEVEKNCDSSVGERLHWQDDEG
jgi:1-deoxy-D-xylulose-5-phosphate synthase